MDPAVVQRDLAPLVGAEVAEELTATPGPGGVSETDYRRQGLLVSLSAHWEGDRIAAVGASLQGAAESEEEDREEVLAVVDALLNLAEDFNAVLDSNVGFMHRDNLQSALSAL